MKSNETTIPIGKNTFKSIKPLKRKETAIVDVSPSSRDDQNKNALDGEACCMHYCGTKREKNKYKKLQARKTLKIGKKCDTVTAELLELKSLLLQQVSQGQNPTTASTEPPIKKQQATFATPQRNDLHHKRPGESTMDMDNKSISDSDAGQFQQEYKFVP